MRDILPALMRELSPCLVKSAHFQRGQDQRNITDGEIALALCYGKRFYEGEDCVYFLGRKQMPDRLDPQRARRADGTTVVVTRDGHLVTAWRNRKGLRALKRRRS